MPNSLNLRGVLLPVSSTVYKLPCMAAQMPRWQDAMERPCSRRKTTQDDTAVVNLSPECSEGSLKNLIVVDWVGL